MIEILASFNVRVTFRANIKGSVQITLTSRTERPRRVLLAGCISNSAAVSTLAVTEKLSWLPSSNDTATISLMGAADLGATVMSNLFWIPVNI